MSTPKYTPKQGLTDKQNYLMGLIYDLYNTNKYYFKTVTNSVAISLTDLLKQYPELKSKSNIANMLNRLCEIGVLTKLEEGDVHKRKASIYRIEFDVIDEMDSIITEEKKVKDPLLEMVSLLRQQNELLKQELKIEKDKNRMLNQHTELLNQIIKKLK